MVASGIGNDWPHGRGCYLSADKGFLVWVGEEDHLRIICMQHGTRLNAVWDRLAAALAVIELVVPDGFAMHPHYGIVTSCPTNVHVSYNALSFGDFSIVNGQFVFSLSHIRGSHNYRNMCQ